MSEMFRYSTAVTIAEDVTFCRLRRFEVAAAYNDGAGAELAVLALILTQVECASLKLNTCSAVRHAQRKWSRAACWKQTTDHRANMRHTAVIQSAAAMHATSNRRHLGTLWWLSLIRKLARLGIQQGTLIILKQCLVPFLGFRFPYTTV